MINIELNKKNKYLLLLIVFATIYTSILVYNQSVIGVSYWDIYVYLQNSMLFSHINIGSQLSVPPMLSLITSIPFRMGLITETTLFAVSGILFVLLLAGMYLVFNERFSPEISFVASIIFSMLSLVVTWAVSGSNDLPALSFSIWALYFTIKGLKNNFNYYYPAFLCFILAFLTRFTEGFILIAMAMYLLMNFNDFKAQLKENNIYKLILFMLAICLAIGGIYLYKQHAIPFLSQFIEVSNSSQVSQVNVGYDLNPFYYMENMPEFLTSMSVSLSYDHTLSCTENAPTILSYVILALSSIGIISFVSGAFKKNDDIGGLGIKTGVVVILSFFVIISYTHISYIFSEILFTAILLLTYIWLQKNTNQMDILMFLWIGIFIILHSYHPVKVDRYIIPIFMPLIYFMAAAIEKIAGKIKMQNRKTTLIVLTVILIALMPVNYSYINSITHPNPQSYEEKEASNFLKTYDGNINQYNISSDRGVAFSWHLKKYTYTAIPRVLEQNNDTLENKLQSINAKYYIDSTSNTTRINGYHIIYNNNNTNYRVAIYEKN